MRNTYSPKSRGASINTTKSTTKKSTSSGLSKTMKELPITLDKNDNVSIRSIENGFIVSESGHKGKGKNQQWFNKEYFTASNPIKFGKK